MPLWGIRTGDGGACCACVMLKAGQTLTFDEMVAFLKRKKLAMFKLPEEVGASWTVFPIVGDSGKIDKKVLKKQLGRSGRWREDLRLHDGKEYSDPFDAGYKRSGDPLFERAD